MYASFSSSVLKKHLHMRGANRVPDTFDDFWMETSPHAWSKPLRDEVHRAGAGNISTCVEQTFMINSQGLGDRKHLHMRGANSVTLNVEASSKETSPHAWSKLTSRPSPA